MSEGSEWAREYGPAPTNQERLALVERELETVKGQNKLILDKLDAIQQEMSRYKGFMGGVAFLVSGAVIVFGLLKGWLFGR